MDNIWLQQPVLKKNGLTDYWLSSGAVRPQGIHFQYTTMENDGGT